MQRPISDMTTVHNNSSAKHGCGCDSVRQLIRWRFSRLARVLNKPDDAAVCRHGRHGSGSASSSSRESPDSSCRATAIVTPFLSCSASSAASKPAKFSLVDVARPGAAVAHSRHPTPQSCTSRWPAAGSCRPSVQLLNTSTNHEEEAAARLLRIYLHTGREESTAGRRKLRDSVEGTIPLDGGGGCIQGVLRVMSSGGVCALSWSALACS
eukprot:3348150-Rhodomonas_salina.1